MSAFPFTVGDRVRRSDWAKFEYVTIVEIGSTWFRGPYSSGYLHDFWHKGTPCEWVKA